METKMDRYFNFSSLPRALSLS